MVKKMFENLIKHSPHKCYNNQTMLPEFSQYTRVGLICVLSVLLCSVNDMTYLKSISTNYQVFRLEAVKHSMEGTDRKKSEVYWSA